jgi:hypothetical protein
MADPEDPKKQIAAAYQNASQAYIDSQKAKQDAANKLADAATKQAAPASPLDEISALKAKVVAGTATEAEKARYNQLLASAAPKPVAPAPKMGSREWTLAQEGGPNGAPREDPGAVVKKVPTTAPIGSREWSLAQGVGPNGVPAGDIPQETLKPLAPRAVDAISSASPQAPDNRYMGRERALEPVEAAKPAIEAPKLSPKKQSAVDKILADMKAETGDGKDKPTIWDVIQAAAAGWNFQTPAYVEKQKAKKDKQAEIDKLVKTAEFEQALQTDSQANARDLEGMREENALKLAGLKPIAGIPNITKGQQAAIELLQAVKGK